MFNEIPIIRDAKPAARPKTLKIKWKGGGSDNVDLTGLIARTKAFAPLEDDAAFRRVQVVDIGVAVEWDCGLDLSGSTLKTIADEQRPMIAAEFTGFLNDYSISIREAASVFGSSESTIKNWRSGKTEISLPVATTVRSMKRDETVLLAHFRPQTRGRPRKQPA